jgi:ABC-type transporter Mla subunit MlaD
MGLIDIHINVSADLASVNSKLDQIINLNKTQMATLEQFESALNRIDTATTGIADQLRDLKEQLTNAGLSADVEAQVLSRLETAATQLEAVGTSVENPVPEPPAEA